MLKESGDLDLVTDELVVPKEQRNGARRQREIYAERGELSDVVDGLAL
jgi:hypothetical protein